MPTNRHSLLLAAFALLTASFAARTLSAQDLTDASLGAQLKSQYKISKAGLDSNGWSIIDPGTVLVIQKGGLLGVPPANLTYTTSTFKDGELHQPGASAMFAGTTTRQLTIGEKVYVLKIDVHIKNDKITFIVAECDSCNGVQQPSLYKTAVAFQFPKDYLAKADISQIKDYISQVLAPDGASGDQQQSDQQAPPQPQQQAPPQQSAPAAQPAATQTVELGQTPDQVKAAMGQPEKIVNLGKKQIFVYKDLKITFVDGKVADVQ